MEAKSGNTTSEFWAGLIVALVAAVNSFLPEGSKLAEVSGETALMVVTGLAALYMTLRSWVKVQASKAEAEITVAETDAEAARVINVTGGE